MSGNRPPRSADYNTRNSKFTGERSSPSEQDPIDRRLKRLREEILPFYPFLLTVPTDVPFRLGNRFVNNWAVSNDGPFTPEEQQLQYMTFLTHHEGDSLLVAVGDWSDETGNVMADPRSRPQSAASTPSNGSVKKKISLNDYKNKRKNGASTSPLSQETASQSGSGLNISYGNQPVSKATNPSDSRQKQPQKNLSPQLSAHSDHEHVERKRPPDREHERLETGPSLSKRPRLSPDGGTTSQKAEYSNHNGLPTLLSPTLPPTSRSPRLPRLLSPTLPPDLEKELAKLSNEPVALDSQNKATLNGDAKTKMQKPKSLRDTTHSESTPIMGPQNPHHKSLKSLPDKNLSTSFETTNSDSHATKADVTSHGSRASHQPNTKSTHHTTSTKPHMIIKLKYGRRNSKRVEALLKFSGKKKYHHQDSPMRDVPDHESSHITRPEQSKVSISDHPSKSIRLEGKSKTTGINTANSQSKDRSRESRTIGLEKAQTPVPNQAQERARPASITPAKDLKHSYYRSESTAQKSIPGESAPAYMAPATANSTKHSPSHSSNTDRNGERRAWKEEYQKYGNMGRELKHAAERHTAKDHVSHTDEKLAAVTAIEAILCFILAFVADDQSKALSRQIGDSSSWLSIIAYWKVVKKNSYPYPPLYSLCLVLGAVSYDAIHALDLERLAVTPVPGEHTPVPTPASDGHSVVSDENKKSLKDFLELKTRLPESYKESQRLWYEGSRGFSEDILTRDFPDTWSKRSRNYYEQGKRRLKPGDYSGELYFPLGKTSTPIEVIRLSCAILKEWCIKEGIDWTSRLDLP